jgi:hypothetical protein
MIDFCVRGEKISSDENLAWRGRDSTGRGIDNQQTVTNGSRENHGLCWSLDKGVKIRGLIYVVGYGSKRRSTILSRSLRNAFMTVCTIQSRASWLRLEFRSKSGVHRC